MQLEFYRIDMENNYRCNMFKVTCLADPQRKAGTPRRLGFGNPQRTAPE
jgi:hypothetical protein